MSGTDTKILYVGCFLLGVAFFVTGLQCFWSDSEIWHLKISILQGQEREPYDYWIKPLFLVFLSGVYQLADLLGWSHPDMGRWVFSLNGLVILLLGAVAVSRFSEDRRRIAVFFLIVGSSWIFLERGFRIRSDLMALTCFLLFLCLTVDGAKGQRFSHRRLWVLFGLFLLTLLVTPKSLLFYLCFLPFLFKIFVNLPLALHNKVINLVLLGLAAFAGLSLFSESFFISLVKQKTYLEGSLVDSRGQIGLFSAYRWEHFINFLKENPLIWVPFLGKAAWIVKHRERWWQQPGPWRHLDISFLMLIPALLIFPNRTPFFICSLTPLLALFLFTGGPDWMEVVNRGLTRFKKPVYALVLGSLLAGVYKINAIVRDHNNLRQKQLYEVLSAFSNAYPGKTIYDPAGLSPSRKAVHFYLGPGDLESNRISSEYIKSVAPDILLAGQRLAWTRPHIGREFLQQYRDFSGNGVYQKGIVVETFKTRGKSKINGYDRFSASELREIVVNTPLMTQSPVWILPLGPTGLEINDVIYEMAGGAAIPQTIKGLGPRLALELENVHFPSAAAKLVIFDKTPYLLQEFNMSQLLRYDPEL